MKIRRDRHGLYIRSRWHSIDKQAKAYRPGFFNGRSHAWDTSDGGLTEEDNPKTKHVDGAPFIRIKTPDGRTIYWGSDGRREGEFPETLE